VIAIAALILIEQTLVGLQDNAGGGRMARSLRADPGSTRRWGGGWQLREIRLATTPAALLQLGTAVSAEYLPLLLSPRRRPFLNPSPRSKAPTSSFSLECLRPPWPTPNSAGSALQGGKIGVARRTTASATPTVPQERPSHPLPSRRQTSPPRRASSAHPPPPQHEPCSQLSVYVVLPSLKRFLY